MARFDQAVFGMAPRGNARSGEIRRGASMVRKQLFLGRGRASHGKIRCVGAIHDLVRHGCNYFQGQVRRVWFRLVSAAHGLIQGESGQFWARWCSVSCDMIRYGTTWLGSASS